HLPRPKNLPSAEWISQASLADHVHLAAQKRRKLVLQVDEIKEAPARVRLERDQDIDIAAEVEIVPQDGAEERQLMDLPLPAEGLDLLQGQGDTGLSRSPDGHARN